MTTMQPPNGTSPGPAPRAPGSPAGVLADARDAVARLDDVLWAAKSAEDLLAANVELERLRSTVAAVQAKVAAEIEVTEAQKAEEYASAADYLTAVSGARRGHGRRLLRLARDVTGDRETTRQALVDAVISPEHAEVVVKVIAKLPGDAELRGVAEKYLLDAAESLNATELRTLGEHLLEVLDPDGSAQREETALDKLERSAHLHRYLSIVDDGLGGVKLRGRGTVEDAAVIKAALSSLSAPAPQTQPDPDRGEAESGTDSWTDCETGGRDLRDHGVRTWDALVEACQRLADAEVLPTDHGIKPRVQVTVDYATLKAGVGTGVLDTGDTLSAGVLRKLACDADLIPGVLGSHGEVLDVGRVQRLVTTAIWVALVLRDRHCAFPGCRRPPIACDAHHVVHWVDGGPTCLDNMVLVCKAHHTMIHSSGWRIRLNPHDRKPEFKPPPGRRRFSPESPDRFAERDGWVRERRPRS